MEQDMDARWKQRFENYKNALGTVKNAVEQARSKGLNDLEKQGLIQGFEFTFELAWNVMKDYLEEQGIFGIIGSKGTIREAFNKGLLNSGQIWMDMQKDRNQSSHSYDNNVAEKIVSAIINEYYSALMEFSLRMESLA